MDAKNPARDFNLIYSFILHFKQHLIVYFLGEKQNSTDYNN